MLMTLCSFFYFLLPFIAIILDLLWGDPIGIPHPVQFIGKILDALAQKLRTFSFKKVAGFFAVSITVGVTCLVVSGSIIFTGFVPYLAFFMTLYWCYAGLALGSLLKAGSSTLSEINSGSLEEARYAMSMLVSRETKHLKKDDLYKTLAETLSENMNDGVIAPFFWFCVGSFFNTDSFSLGVLFLWAYKAVSTMDSMWGYRSEQWKDLGFACAKFDDILAYIPARLTAVFLLCDMYISRVLEKSNTRSSWINWDMMRVQARQMESPNAGLPMATAAWIEGASMGGTATYNGVIKNKPHLGPDKGTWDFEKVERLIHRIRKASLLGMVVLWGTVLVVQSFF